jgi:hypothetical protein
VPTKKQRRKQEKSRRHEWEYVFVDGEGQEVEVDPAELRAAKKEKEQSKERSGGGAGARGTDSRGRVGRQIQPPSWRRVFRRTLIFAPVFVVALMLLNRHGSLLQAAVQAVPLLIFFIPFSYFTDWLAYRTFQKRLARADGAAAKPAAKSKTR